MLMLMLMFVERSAKYFFFCFSRLWRHLPASIALCQGVESFLYFTNFNTRTEIPLNKFLLFKYVRTLYFSSFLYLQVFEKHFFLNCKLLWQISRTEFIQSNIHISIFLSILLYYYYCFYEITFHQLFLKFWSEYAIYPWLKADFSLRQPWKYINLIV